MRLNSTALFRTLTSCYWVPEVLASDLLSTQSSKILQVLSCINNESSLNLIGDTKNNTKVGTKGQTSALEYTYILVKNPEDPENG